MDELDEFLQKAAVLGERVHHSFVSSRTHEIQKQLLLASAILVLVSLGIYSLKDTRLGPALLISARGDLVYAFGIVAVGYFLIIYILAFWADIRQNSFAKWAVVQESNFLLASARRDTEETSRLFAELVANSKAHREFLELNNLGADDSTFKHQAEVLNAQLFRLQELAVAKTKLMRDTGFGSNALRRLVLLLELIIPVALAVIAIATAAIGQHS